MNADKTTPRPWSMKRNPIQGAADNRRIAVAIKPDSLGRQEQVGDIFSLADAKLILRAVNSYEALRAVVDAFLRMDFEDGISKKEFNELCSMATDASNLADKQ